VERATQRERRILRKSRGRSRRQRASDKANPRREVRALRKRPTSTGIFAFASMRRARATGINRRPGESSHRRRWRNPQEKDQEKDHEKTSSGPYCACGPCVRRPRPERTSFRWLGRARRRPAGGNGGDGAANVWPYRPQRQRLPPRPPGSCLGRKRRSSRLRLRDAERELTGFSGAIEAKRRVAFAAC
jgi:hypothetical protein